MINHLFLLSLFVILFACEDDLSGPVLPHEIEGQNQLCVYPEPVDSTVRHLHHFVPHLSDSADTARAYKGADLWRGTSSYRERDTFTLVVVRADWVDAEYFDDTYDRVSFVIPDEIVGPGCFPLSNNNYNVQDSVFGGYSIKDFDVTVERYRLDHSAENTFEILSAGAEDERFRARFKATFLADESMPPYLYPKVRFTQGYIDVAR